MPDDDECAIKMFLKSVSFHGPKFLSLGACCASSEETRTYHLKKEQKHSFQPNSPLCTGSAILCRFPLMLCALDTESQSLYSLIGVAWLHTLQMLRSWFTVRSFVASFSRALGEHLPRLYVPSIISQSSTAWRLCALRQNVLHAKLPVHLPSAAQIDRGVLGSLCICLMYAQDTCVKLCSTDGFPR